jgi:hypothetical protein
MAIIRRRSKIYRRHPERMQRFRSHRRDEAAVAAPDAKV